MNEMSAVRFIQLIDATRTLEDVQNLARIKPWASLAISVSRLYDFVLRQRAVALTYQTIGLNRLLSGTFYSRIDDVFGRGANPPPIDIDFYKECCRPRRKTNAELRAEEETYEQIQRRNQRKGLNPQFVAQPLANTEYFCRTGVASNPVIDAYYDTLIASNNPNNSPAITDGQSRNSTHGNNRDAIWEKSVIGLAPAVDIAHLVPASEKNADSYWFVTDFLFGFDKRDWKTISRLIHGSNGIGSDTKIRNTGIKHMVTNKVLLATQADYYDKVPCVIIVPILTREEALDWNGGAYQAIMLIDEYEGPRNTLAAVCRSTFFSFEGDSATSDEVSTANKLLQRYTRAILLAQTILKPEEAKFNVDRATVFYPDLKKGSLKVRKISFAANNSSEGHPAPDPLLLVTKAIAVLQRRHGYNIVAEPTDTSDALSDRGCDRSIQVEEEEYLRRRESSRLHRDPIGMEITTAS